MITPEQAAQICAKSKFDDRKYLEAVLGTAGLSDWDEINDIALAYSKGELVEKWKYNCLLDTTNAIAELVGLKKNGDDGDELIKRIRNLSGKDSVNEALYKTCEATQDGTLKKKLDSVKVMRKDELVQFLWDYFKGTKLKTLMNGKVDCVDLASALTSKIALPLTDEELEKILPKEREGADCDDDASYDCGYNQAIDDCKQALSGRVGK